MKTPAFRKHKKLSARIFSACVAISFFMTQNASHPAFAFLVAPVSQPAGESSQTIQPEFNLITKNWSHHSLASVLAPLTPLPSGLTSVAWEKSVIKSHKVSGGVSLYGDRDGKTVKRYKYSGGYAEVYAGNNSFLDGKLKEIAELTEKGSRTLKFLYGMGPRADVVKILDGKSYKNFKLHDDGRIGELLEVGTVEGEVFIRERIYDRINSVVTIYNPANLYEKRTYELELNDEPGRLVLYRDRDARGSLMSVRFLYDPREGTVTCVYLRDMSFAVYKYRYQRLGSLMRIGTAKMVTKSGGLITKNVIGISELVRGGQRIPVYSFNDSEKSSYVIRERSLEGPDGLGPVGRVLRYSGEEGDFEYLYEEAAGSDVSAVTVLNYGTGKFLRFEISKKDLTVPTASIAPLAKPATSETLKAIASQVKMVLFSEKSFSTIVRDTGLVKIEDLGKHFSKIRNAFERGPPARENYAFFVCSKGVSLLLYASSSFSIKFLNYSLSVIPFLAGGPGL